jgi:hypothetical protein
MKTQKHIAMAGILTVFAITLIVLAACDNPTKPAHTHDWGNWTQTIAATCTTAGEETRTCTLDPTHTEKRAVAIVPNAHNWQPAPSATAPTCTEDGHGDQICAYNAAHTQSGTIPKLGHDYQNYSQTTAPTCTTAGVETGTCTHDASHTTTRTITALGHNYQWVTTTTATCETAGVQTGTCTRDAVTTTRAVAALGHDYQNWTETTAPTCTTAGVETGTCSRDAATTTRAVAALGHDSGAWHTTLEPDCTTAGSKELRCTVDDVVLDTDTITALGHTPNTETGICTLCDALTYNIGDTGPGGGKIFFRSETGFTMTDTNEICHYIEVSPIDIGSNLNWASSAYVNISIGGTTKAIGAGRKNTTLILNTDVDAPAAKACTTYSNDGKSDWFLPSLDELRELNDNKDYIGMSYVGSNGYRNYYSSTEHEYNTSMVYSLTIGTGGSSGMESVDSKNIGEWRSVRAIRTF